jgi:hypothetical protein
MVFWEVGEICLIIIVGVFIISQLIIPPIIGKRFCWLFRKEEKKVENAEIEYVKAQLEEITEKIKDKTEEFKLNSERERREHQKNIVKNKKRDTV